MSSAKPSGLQQLTQRLSSVFRGRQRAIRELSTLNEVSRAIIRADLDVDALCELVYREASKVLDTSWFHLALFDQQHYLLQGIITTYDQDKMFFTRSWNARIPRILS